jgi:hypothetical protein
MTTENSTNITPNLSDSLDVASACIDACLRIGTGLGGFERKIIAYYCLATYSLPHMSKFPMLVFKGPMGTGKSSALKVVRKFARKPKSISLRGRTQATIRDALAECCDGTAVIEEGDNAWKQTDAESLLSDRYQRDTAEAAIKKPCGDGSWETHTQNYFGATVIHRRTPFSDAALQGRSVTVRFRRNPGKTYPGVNWEPDETLVNTAREYIEDDLYLPSVALLEGVDARIADTSSPILSVAQMLGDAPFLSELKNRLETDTLSLREAQASELEPLILSALMDSLWNEKKASLDFARRVAFSSIAKRIEETQHTTPKPHQIGTILRELGFKTGTSHGISKVDVAPAALIAACEQFGIEDEALSALKAKMLKR